MVANFTFREELLLESGSLILELGKRLGCSLTRLNIPESSPPDVPRLILRAPDTVISWALTRIDVNIQPPSHIRENIEAALEFASRKFQPIIETLNKTKVTYEWAGIIIGVTYACGTTGKRAIDILEPLFDRLVNIARKNRPLSTFQLMLGFVEDGVNVNYGLEGYDTFGGDVAIPLINPTEQKFILIDPMKYPILESGIQFRVDINHATRPTGRTLSEDVSLLLAKQAAVVSKLTTDFGLETIQP